MKYPSKPEVISPKVATWADQVMSVYREGVEAIIETGRRLLAAKADCSHGEWQQLVGRNGHQGVLPFKKSHAHRLMAVARDSRMVPHVGLLPSDSFTLYELTRLSKNRFAALLEDGRIHPGMKRNEACAETRRERQAKDEERVLSLAPAEGKYRTLVLDPPWRYEGNLLGRAKPRYATMSHDELKALPVAAWADDECHIYIWVTNAFLPCAVDLMAHWGFEHKTALTWVKPRMGLGSYFRNSTELILFGVRGELRTRVDDIPTHFEAPLGEHSEKPQAFYDIVRRASYQPVGEVFQRQERPGIASLFVQREAEQ